MPSPSPGPSTPYSFLVAAVAGRRVGVRLWDGALAYSDGQCIFLPSPSFRPSTEIWKDLTVQAALIAAGSLQAAQLRKLIGRSEAARRYGHLEVLRAASALAGRLPSPFLALPELSASKPLTHTPGQSLAFALGRRALPPSPAYFGLVRPLATLRSLLRQHGSPSPGRAALLTGWREAGEADVSHEEQDDEGNRLLRLLQNPLLSIDALARWMRELLEVRASRSRHEQPPAQSGGAEMPVSLVEGAQRRGVHAVRSKLRLDTFDRGADRPMATTLYPEWDVERRAYRSNWVHLTVVDAYRQGGPRQLHGLLEPPSRELRRQLAHLGLDYEMHRHQLEGSEFDTGRLLDCTAELATGHTPPLLDIYRASRRTRRDLAVVVALDVSGSTAEMNTAGTAVFDRQVRMAYQLAHVFSALGDSVAVFGFRSRGRTLVQAIRLKDSEESWCSLIAERFACLEPLGYTRMGAAIRHGTHVLQKDMRLPNRLLILVTDGIAYDHSYESAYAEADVRKALEESRADGCACMCLCVGGSAEIRTLERLFEASNLLVVEEFEQTTPHILRLCQQALGAVSKRRLR